MTWVRQCTVAPVTALHVTRGNPATNQQLVHAGIGPDLLTYDLSTGQLLSRREVLPTSVVHGIRGATSYHPISPATTATTTTTATTAATPTTQSKTAGSLLVYGQKSVALLQYTSSSTSTTTSLKTALVLSLSCNDLISDVRTLQMEQSATTTTTTSTHALSATLENTAVQYLLVVGFAHNNVDIWTCDQHGALQHIYRVESQVRCLLYSMTLYGTTLSELIVGSGTIFNQIVLWDPLADGSPGQYVRGHHGVLFSVRFSKDGRYLCSTSDDRTVRLWKRTGRPHNKKDMLTCSYASEWVAFGHTVRVWDNVFVPSLGVGCVASVAEDGTCRVWDSTGKCLAVLRGHALKSVWSCAVDLTGRVLLTGGGDSSIKLWDVEKHTHCLLDVTENAGEEGKEGNEGEEKVLVAVAEQEEHKKSESDQQVQREKVSNTWVQLPQSTGRINAIVSNVGCSVTYAATANGAIVACNVVDKNSAPALVYGPIETATKLPLCTLSLSGGEFCYVERLF